jgi:aerobic carbon-monoxide dehydrogenase medium subunit
MIPAAFAYSAPEAIPEAIALLQRYGDEAKILAGGHSLIPLMKLRLAEPAHLVDITRIPGLSGIREEGGFLRIGALTREAEMDESALIRRRYPLLSDASRVIADPLVRNMATVGGNLAHADPANDHPAAMLALDASIVAMGPNGERVIPAADFFVGSFETALGPAELLTEIRIPIPPARSGGAYVKLERKVGDYAIVAVAVQVDLAEDGTVARAGIGLTNVGSTAIRATRAEAALAGALPDEGKLKAAAALAAAAADPASDLRGPAEYKRDMVRVLTQRALVRALDRAMDGTE